MVCKLNQCDITVATQELELLPVKELQSNIYIKHPVSMEQYLMEGSYNKVSGPQVCGGWVFVDGGMCMLWFVCFCVCVCV